LLSSVFSGLEQTFYEVGPHYVLWLINSSPLQ
jgi:hypothetical protein